MLNSEQNDALREYMNHFIGQAACMLSEMVERRINLTIPHIKVIHYTEEVGISDMLPSFLQGYVVTSSIKFGDTFSGEGKLIFPRDKAKHLVGLCLKEDSIERDDLSVEDFDAIREIGNIILNAVVGSIGNLVKIKLDYGMLKVDVHNLPREGKNLVNTKEAYLLIIRSSFTIDQTSVEGAIFVILSLESINELIGRINLILEEVNE